MFVKELPEEVRFKISAGEVIESPADCVKELIENSLDAKAKRVEIEIIKGGKHYISVKDDGVGIHPEDLPKVILPFYTSKIERFEDLLSLRTYGFRGEALHAIAQVSRMVISSRFYQEDRGYEMRVEEGKVVHMREKGMAVGTRVEVFDLFYNLPVRRNLLKKEDTERAKVLRLVREYAMARPEVSFKLTAEGRELLNLPSTQNERDRLEEIYKTKFEEREIERDGLRLRVFVSLSQKKGEVKLFVNSRPVQNRGLTEYIKRTVGRRIAVCLLEVPPFVVDANIHPKKLEVKLQREGNIKELFRELFKGHKTHIPSLKQESHPYKAEPELLGILEDTILIVNWMESLYFIDQHLLAERINYEKGQTSDKACKGAIKAGDKLSPAQVRAMLKEWVGLQNPHTCPHGRPIYYRLPLKEVYQQLGRER